jgi:cytoskeleton protein RodZ
MADTDQQQQNKEVEEQSPTSVRHSLPGTLLAKRREEASLSQVQVASELGLTKSCVRDIENNHFEKFAAGIYVRGYLRNYAKLLGIDEQDLMELYDQYCLDNEHAQSDSGGRGSALSADDRRRIFIGISVVLGMVLVVGLLIWVANV